MPDGRGVKYGVGAVERGAGGPSGVIEYTIMRANDAVIRLQSCVWANCYAKNTYKFSTSVLGVCQSQNPLGCPLMDQWLTSLRRQG